MTMATPPSRTARTAPRTARLHVDWTRCDGHGLCQALAPDLVHRDGWGFPVLRDRAGNGERVAVVDARELARLRRMAAACPSLALRVSTGDQ